MASSETILQKIEEIRSIDPESANLYSRLHSSLYDAGRNHVDHDYVFWWTCEKGHSMIAEWIYSLDRVNIHARHDYPFRRACYRGHEIIAKWLHSLGGVDIHAEPQPHRRQS